MGLLVFRQHDQYCHYYTHNAMQYQIYINMRGKNAIELPKRPEFNVIAMVLRAFSSARRIGGIGLGITGAKKFGPIGDI